LRLLRLESELGLGFKLRAENILWVRIPRPPPSDDGETRADVPCLGLNAKKLKLGLSRDILIRIDLD